MCLPWVSKWQKVHSQVTASGWESTHLPFDMPVRAVPSSAESVQVPVSPATSFTASQTARSNGSRQRAKSKFGARGKILAVGGIGFAGLRDSLHVAHL